MNDGSQNIAVVLSGGGIKPFASIPLFDFLKQHDIPVDILAGASGGAILAALYACGFSAEEMMTKLLPRIKKSLFVKNWKAIGAIANLPGGRLNKNSAFLKPEPLRSALREIIGTRQLEELKPKLVLQVTDFETGEGYGLETGDLVDAVYASSAVFPLFPPIRIGERWLCDGGFSAPLPVMQAVKKGADIIIVVDFMEKIQSNPKGPVESIGHVVRLLTKAMMAGQTALSIDMNTAELIYMKVKLERYVSMWETEALPEIVEAGQQAIGKIGDELLRLTGKS